MVEAVGPDVITKKQYAAEWLREMIVSGDLEPGRRVRQQEVANHLGISATPVVRPSCSWRRKGTWIRQRTSGCGSPARRRDRDEVMELRKLLEGLLALSAAQRITEAQIVQLNQLHISFEGAVIVATPARPDGSTTNCTGSSGTPPVATSPDRSFKDCGRGCRGAAWTMSMSVVPNRSWNTPELVAALSNRDPEAAPARHGAAHRQFGGLLAPKSQCDRSGQGLFQ